MHTEKVSNWRDFLRELKGLGKIGRWAIRMANPNMKGWLWVRYGALATLILLVLIQSAVISRVFAGVIKNNPSEVTAAVVILAIILIIERLCVNRIWSAHEHLFGPVFQRLHRNITLKFWEKSIHQHKELKGLNHESLVKGKNRIFDFYMDHLPEATEVLLLIFVSYTFIWFLSVTAGLLMTVLMAVYFSWTLYLNYRVAKECPYIEEEFSAFERYMASRWKFAERVVISAKEEDELSELDDRWNTIIIRDKRFWLWHLRQTTVRDMANVIVQLAVVAYGAHLVMRGEWTSVSTLYPLYAWTSVITSNIWRVGKIQRIIMGYLPTLKVMMATLETKAAVCDSVQAVALNSSGPIELTFNSVSYRYQAGEKSETISNVSFTVKKGERVALVGPSGAGKSTLQYLALRFMDPIAGIIEANGRDIREITLNSWRKAVAYIPQRAQIFDGTVRDNLLYALPKADRGTWSDEKLQKLMTTLAINFGRRPEDENPLDIVVGREGVQLSGGQAQRLAIGAAVIKQPRLMLIDEATSHLDSTTEKSVLLGLNELVSGISTLVIAHRLSTVQSADKIVVMVEGSVEASAATFPELHECSPTFRQLAQDQNLAIS